MSSLLCILAAASPEGSSLRSRTPAYAHRTRADLRREPCLRQWRGTAERAGTRSSSCTGKTGS